MYVYKPTSVGYNSVYMLMLSLIEVAQFTVLYSLYVLHACTLLLLLGMNVLYCRE